ncbi:chemotaxis response regulator containing a CheY-like receiver domain and a methylesterase domain [Thioflavicoccus mobilis 8321]|uniref:protein-glutamate methylesterase n=1 Tax=Thioflavicoccus mobilis 8321 TaxID=765912 RepID=L0GWZ5_9GAMM|nr:chemotaxis response regulator containing a CheY-like receiver domain and a methylesterase domain [Thioflavicoccus mobilis 8321]
MRRIILMGASSGGTEALTEVLKGLRPGLAAAIFVVRHVPGDSVNFLPQLLARDCPLPVCLAANGETFRAGTVYVAPADHHLLVDTDQMFLSRGPRENRARPAIDPLFRSAALAFGPRAVGVVLSGSLDDGTAGLVAVKRSGGIAVVQEPADALNPDMPQSALHYVEADHCLPAAEIGPLLVRLVATEISTAVPEAIEHLQAGWRREVAIQRHETGTVAGAAELGELFPASCPECGGPLWEMKDGVPRYRCHTGHALTARHLVEGLGQAAEEALWAALRVLEERSRMLRRIGQQDAERGRDASQRAFAERAAETDRYVATLRELLKAVPPVGGDSSLALGGGRHVPGVPVIEERQTDDTDGSDPHATDPPLGPELSGS